jgi:histidinol phosphatase-like enzyme (inositol monophosphatase family)
MQIDIREIRDVAVEAAIQAGKITLEYFQTPSFEIELKENLSPVTIADRRAEERIVEIIRRHFPDHSIIGEEGGSSKGRAEVTWIIDPIDGTKSFVRGVPLYGVMIGVEIEGDSQVGVVNVPALGEIHYAARGDGAYWNGRRSHVSTVSELADAALLLTDPRGFARDPAMVEGYRRLASVTKFERSWGDCYGHMLVATGRGEIMLDPGVSVWDVAAVKVIVEEAGGVFTDWNGVPTIHGASAVSTNAVLAGHARSLLRG